jgi:hypothetical protein
MEELIITLSFASGQEYSIICSNEDLQDLILNLSINTPLLQINENFICLRHVERFTIRGI